MSSYRGRLGADAGTGRKFNIVVGRQTVTGSKKNTSYTDTIIHLLKCYVGTGIFALGAAFKNSGILLGSLGLLAAALLSLYCQHQLVNAARRVAAEEAVDVRPSFAETVQYTVDSGPENFRKYRGVFAKVTNGFLVVSEVGSCCIYFVFVAEHIQQVLIANGLSVNVYAVLAIAFVPMWAFTFLGNLKMLTPVSLMGNILIAIGIGMILYMTSIDLDNLGDRELAAKFETYPLYLGTVLFSFGTTATILPLRNEMRDPADFDKPLGVLNVAMVIVAISYISVGFMSYWKYGDDIKGSVLLNFAADDVLCQILKVFMTVAVMCTFTIHMYIPFEITYPLFYSKYGPFNRPSLIKFLYRTFLVVVAYSTANIIPNLGIFISLLGSLAISLLTLVIPPILDVTDREVGWGVMLRNVFIMLIGVFAAATGSYVSIQTAVEVYSKIEEV